VIQLGAVSAVLVDRRAQIVELLIKGGMPQTIELVIKLLLGFFPSAIIGFVLHDAISDLLGNPIAVSAAWIVGGVAILLLDRGQAIEGATTKLLDITRKQALLVGLAQCLALWPGMSRSGSTIIGGLLVKLDRPTATLFSFYLAIPTMLAASGYELLKFRDQLGGSGASFALGMIVSFFVAWATVRWLLKWVASHTFRPFAIYRIVAGIALLLLPPALWMK
jgi:undecaprenyl-diphosphatase